MPCTVPTQFVTLLITLCSEPFSTQAEPKPNTEPSVFGLGSAWVENGSEHSVISIQVNHKLNESPRTDSIA